MEEVDDNDYDKTLMDQYQDLMTALRYKYHDDNLTRLLLLAYCTRYRIISTCPVYLGLYSIHFYKTCSTQMLPRSPARSLSMACPMPCFMARLIFSYGKLCFVFISFMMCVFKRLLSHNLPHLIPCNIFLHFKN